MKVVEFVLRKVGETRPLLKRFFVEGVVVVAMDLHGSVRAFYPEVEGPAG